MTAAKLRAVNTFLAGLYGFAGLVAAYALPDNQALAALIVAGIAVVRLFVGIFVPLPMDEPPSSS